MELEKVGINISPDQLTQFQSYYDLLIEWNQRLNLTAITDYSEVMEKHFYDSLTPAFYHDFNHIDTLADIGSGAGFPSLPLKIVYPHLEITIVDSLNKRLIFLEEVIKALGMKGVKCIHGRAEELGQKSELREQFTLVTARAVARLPVLTELCFPFVKVGGSFVALKGSSGKEEVIESKKAIGTLGGKLDRIESLSLPNEASERTLIWINKVKGTPKAYPRKPGTPARKPII